MTINDNLRKVKTLPPSIFWVKFKRYLAGHIFGRVYMDLNRNSLEHSLLISGTHRSGSTWLADLINSELHYRFIFEPVRHAKDKSIKGYSRRYLRPDEEDHLLKQYLEALFYGHKRTYHLNRKNHYFICQGRLLKDVSSNLWIYWLRQQFPEIPIIYIIRNPYLVVASCKKMDWLFPVDPQFWLNQDKLIEDYFHPYHDLLLNTKTEVEKYILEWCILNMVPLKQFQEAAWHLVLYDDLVRYPEREISVIFDYLHINYDESSISKAASLPSHTAETRIKESDQLLKKWQATLSEQEQETIEYYTRAFGLDQYLGL